MPYHINRVCGVAVTVYWMEQDLRHFSRKLDSEDDEKDQKSPKAEHHFVREEDMWLSMVYGVT